MMIHLQRTSPLGQIFFVSNGSHLTAAHFYDQKHLPTDTSVFGKEVTRDALLETCAEQFDAYFAGKLKVFDLPLKPEGTAFQEAVWREIVRCAYGEIASYGDIAKALNNPNAVRAVGGAVGRNPIAIAIPCHRILGASRAITGYAGGLDRKRHLLNLENIAFHE
jgi:methylated-DNA-[protein]-cysteine S-methyltransferase